MRSWMRRNVFRIRFGPSASRSSLLHAMNEFQEFLLYKQSISRQVPIKPSFKYQNRPKCDQIPVSVPWVTNSRRDLGSGVLESRCSCLLSYDSKSPPPRRFSESMSVKSLFANHETIHSREKTRDSKPWKMAGLLQVWSVDWLIEWFISWQRAKNGETHQDAVVSNSFIDEFPTLSSPE